MVLAASILIPREAGCGYQSPGENYGTSKDCRTQGDKVRPIIFPLGRPYSLSETEVMISFSVSGSF